MTSAAVTHPQLQARALIARFFLAAAVIAGASSGLALFWHGRWTMARDWGFDGPALVLLLSALVVAAVLMSRMIARHVLAVRERERRFMALLGIAADAYWEMDTRFHFSLMPTARSVSLPQAQAWNAPPWDLPMLIYDDETLDAHRADLEQRRPFRDVPLRWRMDDGDVRDMLLSGEPRFDARGVFLGYWGVVRDVSADTRARRALRATQTRHHELFTRIPTPLVLHRGDRVLDANPAAVALFGYPDASSMTGQDLLASYEGDAREMARSCIGELEAAPPGRGLPMRDFRLATRDGRRLVVRATSVRVDDEGGAAILSIYLDDTQRKAAEDAVRRSEALLSHLVATSPDVITLTDLSTGRYAMVNDTFLRLSGYSAKEVIGRTSTELGIWDDPQDRVRLVGALRERGVVRDLPTQFIAKSGQRLSMLVSAARFVMDGRDYLVINARDVTSTERERLERAAILDNASIGVALTRDDGFVLANPAFEQMFGWLHGTLMGQPGHVVWPDEQAYADVGQRIGPALARGEQTDIEVTMTRRDGSTFLCRLLARAVDPTKPSGGGTIWIAEDVTERHQVEEALARARDDAEAASRAKSAFLANTSHEIRTPLNGLMGLARLARQPDVDEGRRGQYLEQISETAETLSAIISDILDLSKIEAGKLHVESLAFDLHALLSTLDRAYASLANARGLSFELQVAQGVPAVVCGDPVRVRQILSNYLTNAMKFTSRGGVCLAVHALPQDELRFEVHDSGPGIDEETQGRLFHPFTQADQSTTRRFGGTGLGLSICRELAHLMHGRVGVESEPGTGSCFWAELPLAPAEETSACSQFGVLEPSPLVGAHVLMVEDNPVNMMIAVALLQQWGAQVEQASDGRQAVQEVERAVVAGRPFDAVLMDVQMPVMGGHEATTILRQRFCARTLPIIALTAAALTSEREAALASGMNDFLTKPIDAKRLRDTLVRVLSPRT